ncbi:MAG: AbrB/MazE/SpoVT family DNA-binding domain-containing protein [Nitrospiraceae bacterium]|nr:AbrB/MazE/SpoVT family DNA-binding domain-containing protein [Nitrospiraceae bacterium]
MNTVKVSPKFQIVIPKSIRQLAGIRPGQKLEVFRVGNIIELAPVKDVKTMRGSLPGLNTEVERADHDRA